MAGGQGAASEAEGDVTAELTARGRRRAENRAEGDAAVARLRWAVRRSRVEAAEVERLADLPAGTLAHVLAGRRASLGGVAAARRVAAVLQVRATWLVMGEGPVRWIVKGVAEPGYWGEGGLLLDRARAQPFFSWEEARDTARDCGGRVVRIYEHLPG